MSYKIQIGLKPNKYLLNRIGEGKVPFCPRVFIDAIKTKFTLSLLWLVLHDNLDLDIPLP